MQLKALLSDFHDLADNVLHDVNISGLALDSRKVQPGNLFFACLGHMKDGRNFIQQAIQQGASAILAEPGTEFIGKTDVPFLIVENLRHKIAKIAAQFYGRPTQSQKIIGTTGTNGKTSCSHFIADALHQLAIPCGVIGTLGSGLYGQTKVDTLTTPDPISLQKIFADFLMAGAKHISMEVSSHGLDQGRVDAVPFEVGLFTNLTRGHLDYHGSMAKYGAAKKKLFDNPYLKYAVINSDDDFGLALLKDLSAQKTMFAYGLKKNNALPVPQIFIETKKAHKDGTNAFVQTPWGSGKFYTQLMGDFNLSNVLGVLTTLCLLDVPLGKALSCIEKFNSVPGRMQVVKQHGISVVIDYSHTPDSLEKALLALRPHTEGKLFCIFGCGGDRDPGMRPMMANVAECHADEIIVTNDNVRTEKPEAILAEIWQGFKHKKPINVQLDRRQAIRAAIQKASPGDCILLAGKGAENYQLIGNEKIPFSDIEIATAALSEIVISRRE